MNSYLTTSQMIDKLKIGEIAEYVDGNVNYEGVTLTRNKEGIWFDNNALCALSQNFLNAKWRIKTNYVSFEKAMEALKEGKVVEFHPEDDAVAIFTPQKNSNFRFVYEDMFENKWLIK